MYTDAKYRMSSTILPQHVTVACDLILLWWDNIVICEPAFNCILTWTPHSALYQQFLWNSHTDIHYINLDTKFHINFGTKKLWQAVAYKPAYNVTEKLLRLWMFPSIKFIFPYSFVKYKLCQKFFLNKSC